MPEDNQNAPVVDPKDIATNNETVKQKLESQSTNDTTGNADEFASVAKGLDDLMAAAKKEVEDAPAPKPPEVTPRPSAGDEAAKKKAEEDAAAAAKKSEEDAAKKKQADDYFKDQPQLPQGASPKSHEAFAAIKIKAAQDLSAKEKEIEALKKQLSEQNEKLKNPVPQEVLEELKQHREFRAKIDVEADPKFKEFDKKVEGARKFIYSRMKTNPLITDEVIKAIEQAGGPDQINLQKFFEPLNDPTLQRIVESKVADIWQTQSEKEEAIAAAKTNISDYMKQREADAAKQATSFFEQTKAELVPLLEGEDFLKRKPDTEAGAKEHNEVVDAYAKDINDALNDNSPLMRAVLIQGTVRLFHERKIHAATVKELDASKKQVEELTAKIEAMKKSSTTRLREGGAAPGAQAPEPKKDEFNTRAGDALDSIAKEIAAKRAAAQG